jgi:hypothetical protein
VHRGASLGAAFRVIAAAEQIGRIKHGALLVARGREEQREAGRDWWVRTWDERHVELSVAALESAGEARRGGPRRGCAARLGQPAALDPGSAAASERLTAELPESWRAWRGRR